MEEDAILLIGYGDCYYRGSADFAGYGIMTGTPEGIGLVEKGAIIRVGIECLGEIEVLVT